MLQEKEKNIYAISLALQLGFYIVVPFLVAILSGSYLDRFLLDKYLLPGQHIVHHVLVIFLVFLVGIYSVWEIRRLILPLMEEGNIKHGIKKRIKA